MTVNELSRDELIELKQKYYSKKEGNISYREMATVDRLVTDEEIFSAFENVEFTEEDFFCNLDKEINNNDIEEEEEA